MKKKRIIVFAVLAAKLGKLFKLLKFGKILFTFLSMVFSILVYSVLLSPWFAVGLVLMLFIHEMGHIIALRMKGYETSGPVFIPFLGAAIFAPKFNDSEEEAFVGYGGPLLGGLSAILLFAVWFFWFSQSKVILLISYMAVFLNLFNLIPVRPLDGGRITQAIGDKFKYLGVAIVFGLLIWLKDPFFAMILMFALADEDFKLDRRLKFALGLISQFTFNLLWFTARLMPLNQPWYIFSLFLLFIIFMNAMFIQINQQFYEDMKENKPETDKKKVVVLPASARWKWFALYFGLGILLAGVMFLQAPYLPKR